MTCHGEDVAGTAARKPLLCIRHHEVCTAEGRNKEEKYREHIAVKANESPVIFLKFIRSKLSVKRQIIRLKDSLETGKEIWKKLNANLGTRLMPAEGTYLQRWSGGQGRL